MSDTNSNGGYALVDLTKMVARQDGLGPVEWAVIIVSGGVGFLGLKAVKHFFPAQASLEEQISNLIALIKAGREAGATKMKFRLSANAGFVAALGDTPFKIENQTNTSIDLEVEFTMRRRTRRQSRSSPDGAEIGQDRT
jgi:hypothetical protein